MAKRICLVIGVALLLLLAPLPRSLKLREDWRFSERECMDIVEAFPFLKALPGEILRHLNTTECFIPQGELASVRAHLEIQLNAHVMMYRSEAERGLQPGKIDLCRALVPARLDAEALRCLKQQKKHGNIWAYVSLHTPGLYNCGHKRMSHNTTCFVNKTVHFRRAIASK
jgi:hypothetical protein